MQQRNHRKVITVGARQSPLSQAQVREVLLEIKNHYPEIEFSGIFVETMGDKDLKTSLRTLVKTDFFTKEVDTLLLSSVCRIAIHSAKDLPDPIPEGLSLAALTVGLDPSDSLVFRPGDQLDTLPSGAIIATSSVRREEAVRQLRADLRFIDLRGTISQRLEKLRTYEADGVVIAEAALFRLGLTHINRIRLPGDTVPYQGQLAILTRSDDWEMLELFSCIDSQCVFPRP
jgi:hydroxymethylbilane synthase